MSPITAECPHTKIKSPKILFKTSKIYKTYSWISSCIMVITVLYDIINIKENKKYGKIGVMHAINLLLLEIASLGMCLYGALNSKIRTVELNALAQLIINYKHYGLTSIFGEEGFNSFKKTSKIYAVVTVLVGLIQIGQIACSLTFKTIGVAFTPGKGLLILFSLLIFFTFLFQMVIKMRILHMLFLKCHELIQGTLNNTLTGGYTHGDMSERKWPLIKRLRNLQRFHCAAILNIKMFNRALHPFILFEFGVTVLMLVICYYLLSSTWIIGMERSVASYLVEFKMYCFIFAMAYALFYVEKIKGPVSYFKLF